MTRVFFFDYCRKFAGIALQELGELDEAASCYEKAIALSPDYVLAHYNLAYVRQDQVRVVLHVRCGKCSVDAC